MASITGAHTSTSPVPEAHPVAVSSDTKGPTSEFHPAPPSQTAEPTTVTTPPQQVYIAATQPDSGGRVTQTVNMQPARRASFSQKVVGYAKEIRGTILRNPETKDYGGKIRKGEEPWPPPSRHDDAHCETGSASDTSASPTG
ncbi:hypothetical protein GSI_04411 [Ganoderma sinense ZZ0214-1]|uniref:Uncharacterized protein n=1 Tax=Ganoderma sinense ZZ0214-1 TaxID=1077348 RepID=A0A2G8SJ35_9APHY|nr:hypothetical protein GSI_04411 [Ganoderma sinense ZZ0214-1]